MPRLRVWVVALAAASVVTAALPTAPASADHRFADVRSGSWAADEIQWAVHRGYVNPISASHFRPDRPMTRGQAVRMLWRVAGAPTGLPAHDLRDVPARLDGVVRWAVATGVVTGYRDRTFRPTAAVRRGQLANWLWHLDGAPEADEGTGLSDVEGGTYAAAVRWAVAEGIATGYRASGQFRAGEAVRRGQAVVWLWAWTRPRLPEVELAAEVTDTNLVTLTWEVRNGRHALAPEVDVEPLVGRRPALCDGSGCWAAVRTGQAGVNRFTITARTGDGGLTQASVEVDVDRPPAPVVGDRILRIDPFADPAPPQVLAWSRPPSVPASPDPERDYVRIRRGDLVFPINQKFPVDGSHAITSPSDRATVHPVSWSIQYCREPEVGNTALCGPGQSITFDPRPALFDAPFRRFVDVGEAVELSWTGSGDRWRVVAPSLGVDEVVTERSYTVPAEVLEEGAHAVTVQGCQGPCPAITAGADNRDRVQIVAGLDEQRPHWEHRRLEDDFTVGRIDTRVRPSTGVPLDLTFDDDGNLWSLGEFGWDLGLVHDGELTHLETPYRRRLVTGDDGIVRRQPVRPFGNPLGRCIGVGSHASALGERVIWTGEHVWFTQGGAQGEPCDVPNHSRLVRFDPGADDDPHTDGDDRLCAVHVPGDDNQVIGIAHDREGGRILFTEPALDSPGSPDPGNLSWFAEDDIACDDHLDYEDPAAVAEAAARNRCATEDDTGCIHRIPLGPSGPPGPVHPTHVVVDEAEGVAWVADLVGRVLVRQPLDGGEQQRFPLPPPTATWSFFGAFDWQLRVTEDAVYVVEYTDNQVLRFDKATAEVDEVFLPLGSPTANAHSIDVEGDRLWFTVADETGSPRSLEDSYVGYLDLATWEPGQAPEGVVYDDLATLGPPPDRIHHAVRGIDVTDPDDGPLRVALAEMGKELIVLTAR